MNLSPKRIPSGGPSVAARIISALDAEYAHAAPSRFAYPGQARGFYSTQPAASGSPDRPRVHPFILQPREATLPVVLPSSLPPPPPSVSDAAALKAMERARKLREKAEFAALPKYDCKDVAEGVRAPAIVYSRDEEEINDLVGCLTGPLGFDMEWRPTYIKGRGENKVATIQICDSRTIIVAQVSALKKIPAQLKKVIEDKEVIKCGLNIMGDGQKLFRDYDVLGQNLVDLAEMSRQADKEPHKHRAALAFLVGKYLRRNLEKGPVRMSNWERLLSPEQVRYAANDAYCGLQLYDLLLALAKQNAVTLKPAPYTYGVKRPSRLADTTSTAYPQPRTTPSPKPSHSRTLFNSRSVTFKTQDENVAVASTSASASTSTSDSTSTSMRPSYLKAYNLWRESNMGLDALCGALRSPINPLKRTTVISYLVEAVRADTSLPFDSAVLADMVNMEPFTRKKYKTWLESVKR